MRKSVLFLFVMALTFALVLAGCGKSSEPAQQNDQKQGTEQSSDQAAAAKSTLDMIKEQGKLVAGVKYDVNLFGLKNPKTGEVDGYDADLLRELAKHIFGEDKKIEDILEMKQVTSKTRFEMVNSGEVDIAAATCTINEERKQQVNFSDVYFRAGQSLLVPKDSPIKSIEDLNEKTTVISVKGSTSEKNIREKAPNAKVDLYDDYAQAFTALKAGKGDVLTTDNSILLGMQKEDPNYVLTGGLFTEEPYGIIIKKGDDEFTKYVNDFLHELQDSGKLAEIYKKWFGEEPPADLLK